MGSQEGVFWLSSRSAKRESDATLIVRIGQGVRFDIGFIGRGNTEISLDKVSRFEREIELGTTHHYISTIIVVDRIGAKSRIPKLAAKIGGDIVQMSGTYWPRSVAKILNRTLGFEHPLLNLPDIEVEDYFKSRLLNAPVAGFLVNAQKSIEQDKRNKNDQP